MNDNAPKIIFLHIQKTAGQSVHAALVHAFGANAVCPARINEQLVGMTVNELNQYRVFSGHLDWSLLDCVAGPRFVFTVLREPRDRILSLYFYLRERAAKLSAAALEKAGTGAALKLTPDQYFCARGPHLRHFIDYHYDNFYTYFFAGRYYRASGLLRERLQRGAVSREELVRRALDNLGALDAVFNFNDMGALFARLRDLSGAPLRADDRYRMNVNAAVGADQRADRLRALGATAATFNRLEQFCQMDDALCQQVFSTAATELTAMASPAAPLEAVVNEPSRKP